MRTTLTIDDDVADVLKRHARELDVPFNEVVNQTLRAGLGEPAKPHQRSVSALKTIPHSFGFRTGLDLDKINQLVDELESEIYGERQHSQARPRSLGRPDTPRRQRPRTRA